MDLVTVKTCSNPIEAHLCRIELLARGIEAYISDENLVAMDILFTAALGGIKVRIDREDLPVLLSTGGLSDDSNDLRGNFYQRFFDTVVESMKIRSAAIKVLIGVGIIIAGIALGSRIETSMIRVPADSGNISSEDR